MTTYQKVTTAVLVTALVGFVYYVGSDDPNTAAARSRRRRRQRLATT